MTVIRAYAINEEYVGTELLGRRQIRIYEHPMDGRMGKDSEWVAGCYKHRL